MTVGKYIPDVLAALALAAAVSVGLGADDRVTNRSTPTKSSLTETATFAGGCFWGLEAAFRQLNGVTDTVVGYTGGASIDHLEACRVTYDPTRISYQQLVAYFLEIHDGTIVDRKSPYLGSPARLVIFYQNPEQEKIAEAGRARFPQSDTARHAPLIQVLSEGPFYRAEEYHQRYLEKHGLASCRVGP